MRKIFLSLSAIVLMLVATSCQQKETNPAIDTETTSAFNDSISEALGNYYGSLYKQDFSLRDSLINNAKFLKGIRTVLYADSTTFIGMTIGLGLKSEMETAPYFAKIDFDSKIVNEHLFGSLNCDSVSPQELEQVTQKIDELITKSMTDSSQVINESCSVCYGKLIGLRLNSDLIQQDKNFDKKQLIKGLEMVFVKSVDDEDFAMGLSAGAQLRGDMAMFNRNFGFVKFNNGVVLKAVAKMIKRPAVSHEEMVSYQHSLDSLTAIVKQVGANRQLAAAASTDEAIMGDRTGEAFIDNLLKSDSTIKQSASGLCYKIHEPGSDVKPTADNTLVVHYTGKHIDGTVFDSSVDRGEPAEFMVNQVIPGFGEGLQLIGKGGKATLYIPGRLGYGPQGTPGGPIKPNETLIFEIELIDIK